MFVGVKFRPEVKLDRDGRPADRVVKRLEEEANSDRTPSRRLKGPAKEVLRVDRASSTHQNSTRVPGQILTFEGGPNGLAEKAFRLVVATDNSVKSQSVLRFSSSSLIPSSRVPIVRTVNSKSLCSSLLWHSPLNSYIEVSARQAIPTR